MYRPLLVTDGSPAGTLPVQVVSTPDRGNTVSSTSVTPYVWPTGPVGTLEGAEPLSDRAEGGNEDTDQAEVVVLPREMFENMVAHLRGSVAAGSDVLTSLGAVVVRPDGSTTPVV